MGEETGAAAAVRVVVLVIVRPQRMDGEAAILDKENPLLIYVFRGEERRRLPVNWSNLSESKLRMKQ